MCLLFVQKGAGIVVVTSMDGGRICVVGKHVLVGGEGDAQGRCGTGVVEKSAARAHGAGVSVSELAQSLWQMTNTKAGEVVLRSCGVGRGVVTFVVDGGSFKMMHAPA